MMNFILTLLALVCGIAHGHGHHEHRHLKNHGDNGLFEIAGVRFANQQAFIDSGARCATKHPSDAEKAAIQKKLASVSTAQQAFDIKIGVFFHVITSTTGEGAITQQDIDGQMKALNDAYSAASSGFSFYLANVSCVANDSWYDQSAGGAALTEMKQTLHQGGPYNLNLYFTKMSGGVLGYATFPWDYLGAETEDGVVILTGTQPGGPQTPYDLGLTAVHEVGHWLGLYHVFQDALVPLCLSDNDQVSDTPVQRTKTAGCPSSKNSCLRLPGPDNIHNYMDYSDDDCLNLFTAGQVTRMQQSWTSYRSAGYVDPATPPAVAPISCLPI